MKNFKTLLFSLILFICFNAHGLIISSQNTFEAHKNLSQGVPFAHISTIGGGIAINEEWILTAAHVAQVININKDLVIISGESHKIKKVYIHPEFSMSPTRIDHDIALIHIENNSTIKSENQKIYPNIADTQSYQLGSNVLMIGKGDLVDLETSKIQSNAVLLAGRNQIEQIQNNKIFIKLNKNNDPLESMCAPGDSGGPLLIKRDKEWDLIGISSHDLTFGEPSNHATYGDDDVYTKVSSYVEWMENTMSGKVIQSSTKQKISNNEKHPLAVAYIKAFNHSFEHLKAFSNVNLTPKFLSRFTEEQRHKSYNILKSTWGILSLLSTEHKEGQSNDIILNLNSENKGQMQLIFILDPKTNQIDTIATID